MEDSALLGTMQNNMPELPEVQTVVYTLLRLVLNKKIVGVDILYPNTVDNLKNYFCDNLKNATIKNITRYGKFIVFHFDNDFVLVSHLRMEGKYFLKNEDENIVKHDLVVFHFSDNTKLIYNDTRKFGKMRLLTKDNYLSEEPLSKVGPDPFMVKEKDYLYSKYRNKNIPIKQVLLDQTIMSGLGNIYADEVLFDTRIHPLTVAKDLNKEECKNLLVSSRKILLGALELGGSTIKSYHPQEGVSGEFQIKLKVYGHKDEPCPNCKHRLRKIFVNGRGTTFCPNCQKRKNAPKVIGITGKTATGKSTASLYLQKLGCRYISADKIVDELYLKDDVINLINKKFPEVVKNGQIVKPIIREKLTNDPLFKKKYENLIHPLVFKYAENEIKRYREDDVIVLEVPLLFETRFDDLCDVTILLTTDEKSQIERISSRGVNPTKAIELNNNFNEMENKKKATYVIVNNNDLPSLYKQLDIIYDKVIHH